MFSNDKKRTPTKILTMSSVFNNDHKPSIWNVQRRHDPTTQRLTLHTTENTITDQFQTSAFSASLWCAAIVSTEWFEGI